jgi:hypothetical protein
MEWPRICHAAIRFGRWGKPFPVLLHVRDNPTALRGFGGRVQVKEGPVKIVMD